MAQKSPINALNAQEIDEEIVRLKTEISRDAGKVAAIRRHRQIRTMISAGAGSILFGAPTFIVYSSAGIFAILVGAFAGFCAMQLYFVIVPAQFALGAMVRRHSSAEEKLAWLFDKRRHHIEEIPAANAPAAPDSQQRAYRKKRRKRK